MEHGATVALDVWRNYLGSALLLSACHSSSTTVVVDLVTDFAAIDEYDTIIVEFISPGGQFETLTIDASTPGVTADPFRLATFESWQRGLSRVSVELRSDGRFVAHARTQILLDETRIGVVMQLTRSCSSIVCSDNETCVAGECQSIDCEEDCVSECDSSEECPEGPSDCTVAMCVEGQCFQLLDESACEEDYYCHATLGCQPLSVAGALANGEPCAEDEACTSQYCADGRCCNTACDGPCEACDDPDARGTCMPYEDGTDPEDECEGFACGTYYAGFANAVCFDRADVVDGDCDGAGACDTAESICPEQPADEEVTDCSGACLVPVLGDTCVDQTVGACENAEPGMQTCGSGPCAAVVAACDAGVPVECDDYIPHFYGPTVYLQPSDRAFSIEDLDWFFLEDFEDASMTLGLTASGQPATDFGGDPDSVDDDGTLNGVCSHCSGACTRCNSRYGGAPGGGDYAKVTYTFDSAALGALPTHVGVVWTDGGGSVIFEAFSACGSLGQVGPVSDMTFPDANFLAGTGDDRFFGAIFSGGITHVTIGNSSGGTESDHIQYGR